jgi:hypothetical protein
MSRIEWKAWVLLVRRLLLHLSPCQLALNKLGIEAILVEPDLAGSLLDDSALVDDQDAVAGPGDAGHIRPLDVRLLAGYTLFRFVVRRRDEARALSPPQETNSFYQCWGNPDHCLVEEGLLSPALVETGRAPYVHT